jgi:hypothetical protein
VDKLRRATTPMTAREIAGKTAQGTRQQAIELQAAIPAALRKRNGYGVTGEGAPQRWRLKEPAN